MRYTSTSPRSRRFFVRRSSLLIIAALCFMGCDKKKDVEPASASDPEPVVSETYDVPLPPPVVLVPDVPRRMEDAVGGPTAADVSPTTEEAALADVARSALREKDHGIKSVVKKQKQRIRFTHKQFDDMAAKVKEAKRLLMAKKGQGKKRYEAWRKRNGGKIPMMVSLEQLEQEAPWFLPEDQKASRRRD